MEIKGVPKTTLIKNKIFYHLEILNVYKNKFWKKKKWN